MQAVQSATESPQSPDIRFDRLEDVLRNWSAWMRAYEPVDAYPAHSAVLSTGGASQTFEVMCEALDAWLAKATDAAIQDLSAVQRCAIHHEYLSAVFRFREDFQKALESARSALRAKLVLRHVVL